MLFTTSGGLVIYLGTIQAVTEVTRSVDEFYFHIYMHGSLVLEINNEKEEAVVTDREALLKAWRSFLKGE